MRALHFDRACEAFRAESGWAAEPNAMRKALQAAAVVVEDGGLVRAVEAARATYEREVQRDVNPFAMRAAVEAAELKPNRMEGKRRRRGIKEAVALTVRLPRSDWERLHQLAAAEGVSLQGLAVDGLSMVLEQRGLPPIEA